MVAAGILLSRIVGLVRQRVFAHYFGTSAPADAFWAAFRIPNLLQNLFGEGALSASFIPVYAGLLARGEERAAQRVAGAVAALLGLVIAVLVLAGVLATPLLIALIAPGFEGATRELTIQLVRILFPGAGLLVASAWCLGVLNSHRRFFLSYAAPVIWNVAIIAALVLWGGRVSLPALAVAAAWGSVIGSGLQFAVQLPTVLRVTGGIRPMIDLGSAHVREIGRNFVPAFFSRGAAQISAYVDTLIASLLPTGAVAALGYAQTLYMLPVSLFGMAISAAELPAMASAQGTEAEVAAAVRGRMNDGLRRIAFFVVPSAAALLGLGHLVAGLVFQTGNFSAGESRYVWAILAGAAVGLLAMTMGRLYSSAFFALRDTRTPLRFALVRVGLATALGYVAAVHLPGRLGLEARWGAAGLALSSGLVAWIELALLRRALAQRVGETGVAGGFLARLATAAALAVGTGWAVESLVHAAESPWRAIFVIGAFGVTYFTVAAALGVSEARAVIDRVTRRAGGGQRR
jgi:putative peptidoglycan lipid II flippase